MVKSVFRLGFLGMLWLAGAMAHAGPVSVNTWYQFSWYGTTGKGCSPNDPDGESCYPSTGTSTTFASAPPWTFVVGPEGAKLKITDAFFSGDRFEAFNLSQSIGTTSEPLSTSGISCEDDPEVCYATAGMSAGLFDLSAGDYSMTLSVLQGSADFGSAYFQVLTDSTPIPTPGTLALTLLALSGLVASRVKRGRGTHRHHATLNQA